MPGIPAAGKSSLDAHQRHLSASPFFWSKGKAVTQAMISSHQGMTARIFGERPLAAGSSMCPQPSTKYDCTDGSAVMPCSLG